MKKILFVLGDSLSLIVATFLISKFQSIFIDLIIINNEVGESQKIVKKQIDDELYRIYTLNSFYHTPGSVTVINSDNITKEDRSLLDIVPRIKLEAYNSNNLKEAIEDLQKTNTISDYPKNLIEKNEKTLLKDKLRYDNGFGGFKNNGKEYVIYNKDTPAPWTNIIANKNFGTVITNNGCGYTYAYN